MPGTELLYVLKSGKIHGPYSIAEIMAWLRTGKVDFSLQVSEGGTADWVSIAQYAPDETFQVADELIKRRKKFLLILQSLCVVLCLAAVGSMGWAFVASGKAKNASTQLSQVSEEASTSAKSLNEQLSKSQGLDQKLTEQEKQMVKAVEGEREARERESIAQERERNAQKQLSITKQEAEDKSQRVALLEDYAVKQAEEFATYIKFVHAAASVPNSVAVEVKIDRGALYFDSAAIRAAIENEFIRAGFKISVAERPLSEVLRCIANIDQLEIIEDIGTYGLKLSCYTRALLGSKYDIHELYDVSTIGFAEAHGTYGAKVRDFFSAATTKCIAEINRAKTAPSEERRLVEEIDTDLSAVGISRRGGDSFGKSDDLVASGSGCILTSRPLIITNHHVVEGGKTFQVYMSGQRTPNEAVLLYVDKAHDLAVLTFKSKPATLQGLAFPNLAAEGDLKTGDEVYSLGYPLAEVMGREVKYSSGAISSLSGSRDDRTRFQISVPTQPGNSGGPLFRKDGKLCGIVVSTLNPFTVVRDADALPQNVNYAIKVSIVRDFLAAHSLLSEVETEKRGPMTVEEAKRLAVRIEVMK